MMPDTPRAIRFNYTKSSDYRTLTANGASASIAPNVAIMIDFYIERLSNPQALIHRIAGTVITREERVPSEDEEKNFDREFQVGLLLTPETARSIAALLMTKLNELDNLISASAEQGLTEEADDSHS
jgi:hypothetical protein